MATILDGKKARDFYRARLAERSHALSAKGVQPKLAIVQVGNNRESSIYIEQKKKFGAEIGATVDHVTLSENISQADAAKRVRELNADESIHGIIVQLPIPAHLDARHLINLIDVRKDVDGLTDQSQAMLDVGKPGLVPATAKGVMALLDFNNVSVKGKKAVVLGRSRLVGHPIAELLKAAGADVAVCHSKTPDVPTIARTADILVVAIGKPHLVNASYIGASKPVVVDVGINSVQGEPVDGVPKRRVVGDVDPAVEPLVSAISPVPGGVGPMTVLSLFDNLIVSAENSVSN